MNAESIKTSIINLIRRLINKAPTNLRQKLKAIRRILRFITWVFPSAFRLASLNSLKKHRILAVYDTTSQPFSVGDLLLFQVASLVLCQKYEVEFVDFAIVYDPLNPASSDPVFSGVVTEDNVLYHIASLLPLIQVNPNLGSLLILDSHKALQRLIVDNSDIYHIWPTGWLMLSRDYLSPVIFNDLLRSHYQEYGSIPQLTCRQFLKDWTVNFYSEYANKQIPVTINIRNNKGWHIHRNSTIDSWIALFQYCQNRYPVKFFVICALAEIDERFRQCANVILTKDHHTCVEQDMALIHGSAMHLGAGSGPATMAWFNKKPYLMVNTEYKLGEFYEHKGMILQVENNIQRFWFATEFQRIAKGTETPELLIKEFQLLWTAVDQKLWQQPEINSISNRSKLQTWLR